jgi:hypothetical protein
VDALLLEEPPSEEPPFEEPPFDDGVLEDDVLEVDEDAASDLPDDSDLVPPLAPSPEEDPERESVR